MQTALTLSPRALIASIDKLIDANLRELQSKVQIDRLSPRSWQAAWEQFPELSNRQNDLFRQRGEAQLARDLADAGAAAKAARNARLRTRKCPECGSTVFAKAA